MSELEGKVEVSSSFEVLLGVRKEPKVYGPNVANGDDACGWKKVRLIEKYHIRTWK